MALKWKRKIGYEIKRQEAKIISFVSFRSEKLEAKLALMPCDVLVIIIYNYFYYFKGTVARDFYLWFFPRIDPI
jgi:hypothetical protein